jgi:RNA polymerase sigma-70 factor (ECF subfamily)
MERTGMTNDDRGRPRPTVGAAERAEASQATPLSLLERVCSNDAEAWRRLVGLYRPLVLFWCARGGVAIDDAEDVAQGVFAAAAGSLGGFRRDRPGDTFRGWLRVVTRNQIALHFRRNRDQVAAEGGSDAWERLANVADPLAIAGEDERAEVSQLHRRAVEQVRGEFEERTWQAFWMTAIEGRSPADLAAEQRMTPTAIRQAKSRVLRRLKQQMGDLID